MDVREVTFMNYLCDVVKKKTPSLPWNDVSKEFLIFFKDFVERTEDDFEKLSGKVQDLREEWEITRIYHFIVEKVMAFDSFPFTWRRFCELLYDPLKNYKKMLPFMHALERVINVRTTSGPHWSPSEDNFFSEFIFLEVDGDFGEKFDMSDLMKGSVVADVARFYPVHLTKNSHGYNYSYSSFLSPTYLRHILCHYLMQSCSQMSMMITDEPYMGSMSETSDDESADAAVPEDNNAVCDPSLCEMGNELHHGDPFQENNIVSSLHCGNDNFYKDFFFVPLSEICAESTVEIVSEEYVDA
ncbi:unnamed protein product [Angiostrongylus costaricensis]|uniref:MADF domain-containing protein n=1 Tax=Angiostrongylus costaricensis TaxID=334426 RepID=A0A0R3PI01_ANGCS|nr:unnamed protein product [Angiostrongylus costaricensis]